MCSVIGIIPARYGSTRFPGKPLAKIKDKPLIQWVYENASKSKLLERIIVATDDARILSLVEAFGVDVVMTSVEHSSGTDRIAEAVMGVNTQLIVNIQGDEPLIEANVIDGVVSVLINNADIEMSTAVRRLHDPAELQNENVVKVVLDKDANCIYFSRNAIPWSGNGTEVSREFLMKNPFYGHIGIYGFRRDSLMRFVELKRSRLERLECLEQLRAIENGMKIKATIIDYAHPGVDVPEDIKKIESLI